MGIVLTVWWLGGDLLRDITGFAGTHLVLGRHSEFIVGALAQVRHLELGAKDWGAIDAGPPSVAVADLNDVVCDLRSAVGQRRRPFQVHVGCCDVRDLRGTWC